VKGVLIDDSTGEALGFATVSLTRDGQTKPAKYTLSDDKGAFSMSSIRNGSYAIVAELMGYEPFSKQIVIENNKSIDLGEIRMKIDREQLLGTIRRVSVCANKASNHIKFDLKPGQLEVSAQDLGFAIAAYEKTACDYSGEDLTIGFKSSFLTDILGNMTCESLVMKFADSRRAVLIVPSEEETESEKICGILMPIMI
jgi:DNA polymerase-3 subunit beta